ncbi:hypothetical protein [Marinobacter alexandrii]|uniref:hypothetical protein n=1 Tax=Marinobacter alexandrii TaxID=2570351 RepID=UPI00329888F7
MTARCPAQTSAIGFAAAAASTKHIAEVKRAYKHVGLQDIARIFIMPFPSSINPSDPAQQLIRSVKASVSDILRMCNDNSHEGLSPSNWILGRSTLPEILRDCHHA